MTPPTFALPVGASSEAAPAPVTSAVASAPVTLKQQTPLRRRSSSFWRSLRAGGPAAATALGLLLFWEFACALLNVPEVLLPAPSAIGRALSEHSSVLFGHAIATTLQTLAAFALTAALGIVTATALTLSTLLKEAVYPYIVALQTVPKVALAPLFTVWLSIGFSSRLAIAVFMSVFGVLVPLMAGLRATPPDALRMAHCAGASRWQQFAHVRFPYALGYLFSGLRIAATTVVIGVVVGEFITSEKGLGFLIMYSASRLETPVVMAAIFLLCLLGVSLYAMVAWADMQTRRWLS